MIPDLVFLGVPAVALVGAIMAIGWSTKTTNAAIGDAQKTHDQALRDQVSKLIDAVSTKVILCADRDEVTREATMMVDRARKSYLENRAGEKEKAAPEAEPGGETPPLKSDYKKEDFITIYGAVALGDNEDPLSQQYKGAVQSAMEQGIRFRRYVRLIKPLKGGTKGDKSDSELKRRSSEVRESYCKWLCRQYDQLLNSVNASLVDNVRAPQWGSAMSTMITNEGILEIKSGGSRALAFYNPSQAASIRLSYRQELDGASDKNKKEYSRSDPEGMAELESIIRDVCTECGFHPSKFSRNFEAPGKRHAR